MIVPRDAIPLIHLQRTRTKKHDDPRMEWALSIERDFVQLAPYLPKRVERFLDIGCGLGGIDVKLYHYFRTQSYTWPEVLLMDGDGIGEELYGYQDLIDYYNSKVVMVKLLRANRVESFKVIKPGKKLKANSLDLVLSLLSWGHHYPVSEYLENVSRALRPGGRLILDVRKGRTDPDDFSDYKWIVKFNTPCKKSYRTVLERKSGEAVSGSMGQG